MNTMLDLRAALIPSLCAIMALGLVACGGDTEPVDNTTPDDAVFAPPLATEDSVIGDAPTDPSAYAKYDQKFDLPLPERFDDLLETQSPVRNQRSRGVCSIFSTIGLMESIYISEGVDDAPDFSEQYLQWSTKFEVKAFQDTGGSSGRVNLQAITRYGIVEESVWPYEGSGWNASNDPACGEEDKPTICYTNGEPTEEMKKARKFRLDRSEWVSSNTKSLKTYMLKNKRGVIAGMTFFYQSWSHGGSNLKTNSDLRAAGLIAYPGEADKKDSLEVKSRAGHSILLVGWDDNVEIPVLDEAGKALTDPNGNPIVKKGCFLFKNSWGDSWAPKTPAGKTGYGCISYDYVQEFASSIGASGADFDPVEEPKVEICGDGVDNDGNGAADCQDAACSALEACQPQDTSETYSAAPATAIPDNDQVGISSTIAVDKDAAITSLEITVDISHTWIGDLDVILSGPNGDLAILKEKDDASDKDLKKTFTVTTFNGVSAAGEWTLNVVDNAAQDTGVLNSWSMKVGF